MRKHPITNLIGINDYATAIRQLDGATISYPSGHVIAPPFWVSEILNKQAKSYDGAFKHKRFNNA